MKLVSTTTGNALGGAGGGGGNTKGWLIVLLLITSNILVIQLTVLYTSTKSFTTDELTTTTTTTLLLEGQQQQQQQQQRHPFLDIPQGKAVALPPPLLSTVEGEDNNNGNVDSKRSLYGGKGDKAHLGGFLDKGVDMHGVSPAAWKWMVERHGVHSLLDVGCGRGISTSWFNIHGVDAHCVEGSHDAVMQTVLPLDKVTQHDYARGPWWPPTTVDAVWTVELLEHVGRNFHMNLMPTFKKAALVYATHSTWGGWHHVEVHDREWWIARFQSFGFVYSESLSSEIIKVAKENRENKAPNGEPYFGQHIFMHMMVFINPTVASLPQHHHLLSDLGCYKDRGKKRPCRVEKMESTLPPEYEPLVLTDEMDAEWETLIFGSTNITTTTPSKGR